MLLLAWNGSEFERQVGADLGTLSATRHALGRWLSSQGADHATRMDVVLAVSEALANAAEHGLHGDPTESGACAPSSTDAATAATTWW